MSNVWPHPGWRALNLGRGTGGRGRPVVRRRRIMQSLTAMMQGMGRAEEAGLLSVTH